LEKFTLFLGALGRGLSATLYVYQMPKLPRHDRSDVDAMRGDWMRVGDTMRAVITGEINAADARRIRS
jgi:hypothetical protein